MKNKIIIGLCGRSGSGKSYVCKEFSRHGGLHLDTDRIYHELLEPVGEELSPCTAELCRAFGCDILTDGKTPDRKKLGSAVFSDGEKLKILNSITHKYIFDETMSRAEASDAPFAVMDAPVLFESGFDKYCDFTVCVVADDKTCIRRITERDGIDEEKAVARLRSQLSVEKLKELCHFFVDSSDGADVPFQVKKILAEKGLCDEL